MQAHFQLKICPMIQLMQQAHYSFSPSTKPICTRQARFSAPACTWQAHPRGFLPRKACRYFLFPRATRFPFPRMSSSLPLTWPSMSPYNQTSPSHVPSPLFPATPMSKSPITQLRIPWPLHRHQATSLVSHARHIIADCISPLLATSLCQIFNPLAPYDCL